MKTNRKNSIISIIVAVLVVFAMMPMMTDTVFAETVTKDGITYTLDDVNQTAVVSGHTDDLPAVITIPAIVNNSYKVTAVGNSAFWNTRLESVTFETGSNLTSIGESAFADCYDIKTITIPASVTSIGKSAFFGDTGLESVTFEPGISLQSIEEGVFQNCSNLSAITIPKSVTSIGKSAFRGDTGLETVTFEQNTELKTIGQDAFNDCASLKDITIPKSVTSLGYRAFVSSRLESVTFEPGISLQSIEEGVFHNCSNLSAITIPKSVTNLEKDAFANSGLTSVTFETGISLQSIEEGVFQGCGNLSAITIPKSVTNLEKDAFANSGLTSVTFETGSRLEVIGYNALGSCGNLKTITIPKSVTSIGEEAFSWGGLQSITFEPGSRLETIGDHAFRRSSLAVIHYIGNETAWDNITKGNDWKPDSCLVHCVPNTTTKKATLDANGYFGYICNEEGCNEWSYGRTGISKPAGFTLSKTSYTYDGTKKKPAVTVKDSDGKMIDRSNYDVAYSNNVNAGKAIAIVTFKGDRYEGSKRLTFTINKAANPLKMKPKPATVKFRKLKIKDQYLTVGKVITFKNKGQGTRSYKLVSAKKGKQDFKKKFTVNSKTGKVTAKKGLKKGKYKVKIKVTAAGNDNYKKVTKPVTVTIKVE